MLSIAKKNNGVRVLIAGSILQFLLGIIYVWSVFVKPLSDHLLWNEQSVKLTLSYMLCFFAIGILAGGKLQVRLGTSKTVLVGGLAMALGTYLTSFVSNSLPWLIYLTYGILGGFGVGMAYNAVISAAPRWFPKNKGLVTGISVFSFGFATVVFAPLVERMTSALGVPSTFRILAVVFAVASILLFSFIITPPNMHNSAAATDQKQYTTTQMLKTKQFYCIVGAMMLGTAAYFVVSPSFKTLPTARAMEDALATSLVMFTGIANALGRLAVPLLSDKIGHEKTGIIIFGFTAVGVGLLTSARGTLLFAAISLIAFFYGGTSAFFPVVTGKYFGTQYQGANYGMVMLGFGLSSLVFPNIMSLVTDEIIKFSLMAAISLLGVAIFIVLPRLKQK